MSTASNSSNAGAGNLGDSECPICHAQMTMPVAVPGCDHKFCFTCIKGVYLSNAGGLCPLCRRVIDSSMFEEAKDINLKMYEAGEAPDFSKRKFVNADGEEIEEVKPDVEALNAAMRAEEARKFWVYEGRGGGWWRFEPRVEKEIEEAYNKGDVQVRTIIVGRVFIVDFNTMQQYGERTPQYSRTIKRIGAAEFDTIGVKGVAGAFVQQ